MYFEKLVYNVHCAFTINCGQKLEPMIYNLLRSDHASYTINHFYNHQELSNHAATQHSDYTVGALDMGDIGISRTLQLILVGEFLPTRD